ncbi:DUF202 domain-containing protein [Acrocarpospora sp. B8E8]|uniref:DUF202 domain-containing protein n=1 Tax=Acrocarpospora sp. B8E8 TaxID=3153572 RepID=UPI00325CF905
MSPPFDAGLQPERTLLAWRRTCLSLVVGSAIVVRVTASGVSVLVALVALVLAAAGWLAATLRYRRAHRSLARPEPRLGLGGVTVTVCACAALLLGCSALILVLVGRG